MKKRVIITNAIILKNDEYLKALPFWSRCVRSSGWKGDVIIFSNRIGDIEKKEDENVFYWEAENPTDYKHCYRAKTKSALKTLEHYDEVLFLDSDILLRVDPNLWAFESKEMLISQDVWNMFHPNVIGTLVGKKDDGTAGANTGVWCVKKETVEENLLPWDEEMHRRIREDSWPKPPILNDETLFNYLLYKGEVKASMIPRINITYPYSTLNNYEYSFLIHYCGRWGDSRLQAAEKHFEIIQNERKNFLLRGR